jgi:hypothetical protein
MGITFFVFGLNFFVKFMPPPHTPMSAGAVALFGGMMKSGYMLPLVGATQFIVGVLLLCNRYVPLALALIAPVIVNIILFHSFLQPAGIGPGIVVAILEIYLVWSYRAAFRPMLASRTEPGLDPV